MPGEHEQPAQREAVPGQPDGREARTHARATQQQQWQLAEQNPPPAPQPPLYKNPPLPWPRRLAARFTAASPLHRATTTVHRGEGRDGGHHGHAEISSAAAAVAIVLLVLRLRGHRPHPSGKEAEGGGDGQDDGQDRRQA